MKLGGVAVAVVLVAAVVVYLRESAERTPAGPVATSLPARDDPRVAQLSRQLEEMQRNLAAMKTQLDSQKGAQATQRAKPTEDSPSPELDVEAQRAQDAERRRQYMAEVAAAFNNEKVDAAWATRVSSRISASFEGDERLRSRLRNVECRSQTCRVQIDEDDSNDVFQRMPRISLALVDVLPTLSAEHLDQGNGHRTMIVYMSSQRPSPSGPRR